MTKVFIDGSAGTTGLRIYDRLSQREDLQLIILPDELRKDANARRDAIASADIAFLCLPDAAAVEAATLAQGSGTALIDTSTAHRVSPDWEYGFPELSGRRERIASSKRIANPGCHASGFIALVEPLRKAGIIPASAKLSCFSLTGYSGGGKKMIAEYESADRPAMYGAPRQYGLPQQHKHLREMVQICGLDSAPAFCPIVADFYSGMEVTVSLFGSDIKGSIDDIRKVYAEVYNSEIVHYDEQCDEEGFMSAGAFSGRDDMQITVCGNDERILLVSRFDNLGKGASGAAIQNMNILLGVDERTGLNV
ncbi:MAG: N-acetyl-gamma-glutamyl-phosphate reductase [Clostridia bacterium]|nr:N-acetyl-gamma-glutamyl-phosphate reductase [Clostridia bacterium]